MQVTQKSAQGLARTFGVTIPAGELDALLTARIDEVTPTLRLKGFRPGKVPKAHVRRLYGKALMGEVLDKTLSETSQKVLTDNGLRIAAQPELAPTSDMAQVIAGQADLAFDLSVEVMPEFEPADVAELSLERPVHPVGEAEIAEALDNLAKANGVYAERKGAKAAAQTGDQLLIDFVGTIDGKPFEGGAAQDVEIVLGEGRFLPGFEDGLAGAAKGAKVEVETDFPADYPVERLKGRRARFEVTVKAVRAPVEAKADDALAERLGMKDLAALEAAIRASIERENAAQSRVKLKRALLDKLDAGHVFALPQKMVEAEFDGIWKQLEHEREHGHMAEEDEGKDEATLRAEYRRIAERRVRLGLVLAEIGARAEVKVGEQEVADALRREASRYGDQAQKMFEAMRGSEAMQAQVRAPIYEEKVVDWIIERATVTDRTVSKAELFSDDELPEGIVAEGSKAKKPPAKKAAAKKSIAAPDKAPADKPKPVAKRTAKVRP